MMTEQQVEAKLRSFKTLVDSIDAGLKRLETKMQALEHETTKLKRLIQRVDDRDVDGRRVDDR